MSIPFRSELHVFSDDLSSMASTSNQNNEESQPDESGDVHISVEEEQSELLNDERKQPESLDALAKAISSTLGTVIRDFDSKADRAISSQDELGKSLDRLTTELDKLLEDAPLPVIMHHAAKIASVRKRVSALNSLLSSIQLRIDKIDLFISTGSSYGMGSRASSRSS